MASVRHERERARPGLRIGCSGACDRARAAALARAWRRPRTRCSRAGEKQRATAGDRQRELHRRRLVRRRAARSLRRDRRQSALCGRRRRVPEGGRSALRAAVRLDAGARCAHGDSHDHRSGARASRSAHRACAGARARPVACGSRTLFGSRLHGRALMARSRRNLSRNRAGRSTPYFSAHGASAGSIDE